MLRQGKIKNIKIECVIEGGVKNYEALITTDEGKSQILPIADADSFVLNLDKAIGDFIVQGAPLSEMNKLNIE